MFATSIYLLHFFSVAVVEFAARPGETFVIVGSACGMVLNPHTCNQGYLYSYKVIEDDQGNTKLQFLHKVVSFSLVYY